MKVFQPDSELQVLKKLILLMGDLTPTARARVLEYLTSRYGSLDLPRHVRAPAPEPDDGGLFDEVEPPRGRHPQPAGSLT